MNNQDIIAQAVARARERLAAKQATTPPSATPTATTPTPLTTIAETGAETASSVGSGEIVLNKEQQEAVELGSKFTSFCLIGAAGTGKTTSQNALVSKLLASPLLPRIARGTKYLAVNSPGIAIVAFTRRAVRNIRRRMPPEIQANCLTIHSLLQYAPTTEPYFTPEGELRERKVYKPTFTELNKLPDGLRTVIVEEASMVSTDLFHTLLKALPYGEHTQFIFLGDLNQIPPVYGNPILAKKLLSLPCVELTQVYRQALESPILRLAHQVREGMVPAQPTRDRIVEKGTGEIIIRTWQTDFSQDMAEAKFFGALRNMVKAGDIFANLTPTGVDPDLPTSVLLCPWNKNFGNDEMNKIVGEGLARKFGQEVYEVICGYRKRYFRVGEQVLVGKLDATITKIERNLKYVGTLPKPATKTLNYSGYDSGIAELTNTDESMELIASMLSMEDMELEEVTRQASHTISYRLNDSEDEAGEELKLTTASEILAVDYSYCLSIHKAQGSEWDQVFLLLHKCHMRMASRELLYTAITRAKNKLEILQPLNGLHLGSRRPRIKGVTLAEKLAYLKTLLEQEDNERLTLDT